MAGLIKWFSSNDTNAPQLSNTWNCMIDVLDACLVTGYNTQQVSLFKIENGVGVVTFPGVHNYKQFQVLRFLSELNPIIHNKEFKVLGVTGTTVELKVDLPDQTISGVIACQLAPLGWSKPFGGVGKAVYQAKDTEKNPFFLRVDNSLDELYNTTYAKIAKVGILETCEGIDDISGIQIPFDPTSPNKNWVASGAGVSVYNGWFKWRYAAYDTAATSASWGDYNAPTSGTRDWFLIGDDDVFYIVPKLTANTIFEMPYAAGFVQHNGNSKPFLIAANAYNPANSTTQYPTPLSNTGLQTFALMRDYENNLINTQFSRLISGFGITSSGVAANTIKADIVEGLILTPFYIVDSNQNILTELPLAKCCINNVSDLSNGSIYADEYGAYIGTRYRTTAGGALGALFFEIYKAGV